MTKTKPHSQGPRTQEQRDRELQRKDDMPRRDADGDIANDDVSRGAQHFDRDARQSEFPVSRGGMNQESRQHNKPAPE
jgi:hypothetical protein